jgi:hypothetical protein
VFDVPSNLHAEMEVSIASGDMGTKNDPWFCQPLKDMAGKNVPWFVHLLEQS